MLRTAALTFAYPAQTPLQFPDLEVPQGEHLLILGQSGKGKTTLLHLLAGLLRPSSGSIEVSGTDISRLRENALDHFRGQHIGIIFQKPHFVDSLTVKDNLLLTQYLAGLPQDGARAEELLGRLRLGNKGRQKPYRLSIGEQQRAAIARAILNRPQVILADEPTSSLDDENCHSVIHLLNEQAAAVQASLIIVTHDQRLKDEFPNRVEL